MGLVILAVSLFKPPGKVTQMLFVKSALRKITHTANTTWRETKPAVGLNLGALNDSTFWSVQTDHQRARCLDVDR